MEKACAHLRVTTRAAGGHIPPSRLNTNGNISPSLSLSLNVSLSLNLSLNPNLSLSLNPSLNLGCVRSAIYAVGSRPLLKTGETISFINIESGVE